MAATTRNIRLVNILTLALLFFFIAASTTSPLQAFTIKDERELGEKLLYSVRAAFPLLDDPDLSQYLNVKGREVLEVAGIQYFDYRFYVVSDKQFNAFAAPSGLIFFYTGLIEAMNSEDELVSVIGHEIGHVVSRHLAERIEIGKYSAMTSLGLALAALALGGASTPVLLTGALATGQSMNLHFSRQNEQEADNLAYDWLKQMGRNPEGQAKMLETMRRVARYRSDQLPQYLLTHPNPEGRLDSVQSLLDVDRSRGVLDGLKKSDNFHFLRFKYRILALSKDGSVLRPHLASVISRAESNSQEALMAKYGLSQLSRQENDQLRGLKLLEEVIAAYPDEPILLTDKGVLQMEAGQVKEAEISLKTALRANRDDRYASFQLARLYILESRVEEAKAILQQLAEVLPEYANIWYELGRIASVQGRQTPSIFYLGKYNLLEGKLKLAESNFKACLRTKDIDPAMRAQAKELLAKVTELQK